MNSLADALKKANIEIKETLKFKPFETLEDVVLPCMVDGSPVFYTISQQEMKDANYIRSSMVSLDTEAFKKQVKLFEKGYGHGILQWIISNADKCYEINTGCIRRSRKKYVNPNNFEEKWEKDTEYGKCCLAYYVEYSPCSRELILHMNHSLEYILDDSRSIKDTSDVEEAKEILRNYKNFWISYPTEDEVVQVLGQLAKISEFVPIFIDRNSPVVVFNYWDEYCFSIPRKYSSLGVNILESESAMEHLKDWLEAGGKINPKVWYYLNQSEYGEWYLKRDLEKSPRKEYN